MSWVQDWIHYYVPDIYLNLLKATTAVESTEQLFQV